MANYYDNKRVNAEPYQKLPLRNKTESWKEDNVNSIIGKANFGAYNGNARKTDMKVAYDLYNSVFNEDDFKYITDPYKTSDSFPASLQNFNIIKPKIDLLEGEETKRPFPFKVAQVNDEATSKVQNKYKELLFDAMMTMAVEGDPEEPVTEKDIDKLEGIGQYMQRDYTDIAEQQALHSLNYLKEKEDTKNKFMVNFHDLLCANTEVGFVGQLGGEPVYERVNPLYFSCDISPESGHIEDGDWAARKMHMTWASIYDRFYDIMSESELDQLLAMFNGGVGSKPNREEAPNGIHWREGPIMDGYNNYVDNTTDVWHVVWRSLKKVGFLTFIDEEGEPQMEMVDETYKADDGEEIEWDWVTEIWEGYRIGNDLYLGMGPMPSQSVSLDNPNSTTLPYIGTLFTYKNTDSKSLVEIMKPLQYFYIAIMYQLQLAIARDKGKIITVDVTQIPKSLGIDANKWLHYLSSTNVNFINPYECFSPGTKVMMYDGSIKNIEEIVTGDLVMGPDGKPKTVLHTHSGEDHMWRLKHRSGAKDQIVNSAHKNYYFEKDYYSGNYKTCLKDSYAINKENHDKPYKSKLRYTKRATDVDGAWDRDLDLYLKPYFLGLWLGDGSKGRIEITTIDFEIANYLERYSEENGLEFSVNYENPNPELMTIRVFKGIGFKNPIKGSLHKYGILDNKDIPDDYIYTSRYNRLQLLAGLIDTDGSYSKRDRIYTFSQCEDRKHIVEKAAFIARSLGFKVTVNKYGESHEKYICDSDNISTCQLTYTMSILDWDVNIPTKVERKQASCPNKRGDKDYSAFTFEYEGEGSFHGIHVDGDNLFVLDDFTIVHNTGWDTPGREGGKPAQHTQFGQTDLTMSNVIVQYIQLMQKIEDMIGELSGVSRQRQGQVQSSELVGNVQQTIVQSSHITEYLFTTHTDFKRRVFTALLNTAKNVWANSGKEKIHYFTDDMVRVFMDITDDFIYSDMGIFITDATREHQNVEALKQLAQPAMQNGASLLDIANIYTSDNLTDIKNKLTGIEKERKQREDDMQRMQQEAQQQQTEVMAQIEQGKQQLEQEKLAVEENDSIRKADTSIQVALINAESKAAIEAGKQDLDLSKLDIEAGGKADELNIKDRELAETKRSNMADESIKRTAANKPTTQSNK